MFRKKRQTFTLALFIASLLLSACSLPEDKSQQEKPIQISLTQDILSFDPMRTIDIFSEAVLRCVYTSLYDFDAELQLRPKLAKNATRLDDYTWRVEIHDNVKFHDGSRLTSEDVIFSLERARRGGRTQKALELVDSLEKVNDTTLLIRSKEPFADFLSLFAKAETSIVSKALVETAGYNFAMPIGAGPFKCISRKENSEIRLERFNDYYLEKAASPYLNFVVLITEQERATALLNGDVDILFSVSAYDCDKLKLSPGVRLLQAPASKIEYLSLNTQHAPLDNPKVRLAISHAINRKAIANNVYHGYSIPSSSLMPKGIPGYLNTNIPHDPSMAKKLLQEAGYKNGFKFTVITIDTIRKNTLEYIKLDLAAVGIEMNYSLVTMKKAADMMLAGEHDSILVGWAFSSNPNSVLPLLLGTGSGKTMNSSNYSNALVDELLRKGREESNEEARRKLYEKVNQIVTKEAPIVVLQHPEVLSAARDTIEGIHFNPQGLFQYESLRKK